MLNYKNLIEKALKSGFSDFEIVEKGSAETVINIFNGAVDKNSSSSLNTVTIRAIVNGKMANLDLEDLEIDENFILENLKNNAKVLQTKEQYEIFAGSKEYPEVKNNDFDFNAITTKEKIGLLTELEGKIKQADKRIVVVPYCQYVEQESFSHIMNSKGLDIQKNNKYCLVALQAVASENNDTQSSFQIEVKNEFYEFDKERIVSEVVRKAVSMLQAKPVDSKNYQVIIENDAMSDLLQVFTSAFSGEAAIKKITPMIGKEETQIMSDKITIIDNPLKEDAILKEPFDDEGVACYSKEIVKNGVFKTFLHNLKTAKYFNTTTTGNGFKTGSTVGVSCMNCYIENGNTTKEEMIASLKEGLLLTNLDGLHSGVNAISGDFSLKASGYYILDGKINRAVTLIVVASNFYKMMKDNVNTIGNDLKMGHSGVASPSILFDNLAISGN